MVLTRFKDGRVDQKLRNERVNAILPEETMVPSCSILFICLKQSTTRPFTVILVNPLISSSPSQKMAHSCNNSVKQTNKATGSNSAQSQSLWHPLSSTDFNMVRANLQVIGSSLCNHFTLINGTIIRHTNSRGDNNGNFLSCEGTWRRKKKQLKKPTSICFQQAEVAMLI